MVQGLVLYLLRVRDTSTMLRVDVELKAEGGTCTNNYVYIVYEYRWQKVTPLLSNTYFSIPSIVMEMDLSSLHGFLTCCCLLVCPGNSSRLYRFFRGQQFIPAGWRLIWVIGNWAKSTRCISSCYIGKYTFHLFYN